MARGDRKSFGSNGKQKEESPRVKISKENLKEALALYSYVQPYRVKFVLSMVFIGLSAFTTLLFPFLLGKMIDAASPGTGTGMLEQSNKMFAMLGLPDFRWDLNTVLILIIGQLLLQALFSFMRIYLLTEVGERSLADMRRDVYTKILSMPMSFFSEKRVGELSSRLSSDLSQIQDAISFTFAEFLRGIFTLVIGLVFIFTVSTKLAMVMLAVVPVIAVLAVVFGLRIRKMSRKAQDQLADSGTIVQETFQGVSIVKAFTNESYEIGRYFKSIYSVVDTAISNARYRGAFVSFMIFSVFGAIAFVIWYGANMIQAGQLSLGDLTSFVIFSAFVGATFAGFADMFSQLQKTLGATQSIREILRSEGESVSLKPVLVEPRFRLEGEVTFDQVAFSYPGRSEVQVLDNISLNVRPGEQVAIVGPSGAGKSTMASLLLRFYEPTKGRLLFDQRDASLIPLSQVRKQTAFVPQDIVLFGGSIRENIAYARPEASIAEIEEAAKKANAHEFISRFPEGYETIVGERGMKLSGGQRQRIAIARAILKDPVILILDEATSSLDSESEQQVQDALQNLMKGRTSFVIAHRLSTIRNASTIIVIDKGVVIEQGTHEQLMNANRLYRRLNEMQFEYGSLPGMQI